MKFQIKRNQTYNTQIDIEKDGQKCALFGHWLLLKITDDERCWKAASEISKATHEIFGEDDRFGLSCGFRTDIFTKNDEGFYDGICFINEITEDKIHEFVLRFGDEKSINRFFGMEEVYTPKTKECEIQVNITIYKGASHQKRIMELLEGYQPELYKVYDPHNLKNIVLSGLTSTEEEYDDYIDGHQLVKDVFDQLIGARHTCWRRVR